MNIKEQILSVNNKHSKCQNVSDYLFTQRPLSLRLLSQSDQKNYQVRTK